MKTDHEKLKYKAREDFSVFALHLNQALDGKFCVYFNIPRVYVTHIGYFTEKH